MKLFYTDYCAVAYADLERAVRWWVSVFDCKQVTLPLTWDDPMPEDIALQLPGEKTATILLYKFPALGRAEWRPILFTSNINRARTHLLGRGVDTGLIDESGGSLHFDVRDSEGHSIEICLDV